MKRPSTWRPRKELWFGLAVMLLLAALPHLWRLHPLAALGWLSVVAWRTRHGLQGGGAPPFPVRLLLIGIAALALYWQHGTLLGRDAGSALLVMMVGLKYLELRAPRDATVLVFLCYFLVAVQFLFSQAIPMALYLILSAVLTTGVWIQLNDPLGGRPWRVDLVRAARMLVQALPLMLVLFVLFPRIPGPLWSLPHDAHAGLTGLSGQMEMGSIGSLALSEAIAFRVEFQGQVPPPDQRYWRGPVLEVTDGRRWSVLNEEPPLLDPDHLQGLGEPVRYAVTLEPHGQRWLLALDYPFHTPPGARRLRDLQLVVREPVHERRRYELRSYPQVRWGEMDWRTWVRTGHVPETVSDRVRTLARRWAQHAASEQEVVAQALQYFRQQPFVYTLTPPLLGGDPVDEFLFETRRGFCEHYAAAFTILMRVAGLPARVVTGYQGGERNPLGGYLVVRQSDAHAWSEVWLEGRGWVRVDPTAAVAPERIEHAIDLVPSRQGTAVRFRVGDSAFGRAAWRQLRNLADAFNNGWNQWVLSYGPSRQYDLFHWLGLPNASWREIGLVFAGATTLALLLVGLWALRLRAPHTDPVQKIYQRFCRRLARRGVERRPQEGPIAFGERAAKRLPEQGRLIRQFSRLYAGARYGRASQPGVESRLRGLLMKLR